MNRWQDIVFFTGSLVFVAALIPALKASTKPPTITSTATSLTLCAFAGTYASMQFWLSAAITFLTASAWAALAMQGRAA